MNDDVLEKSGLGAGQRESGTMKTAVAFLVFKRPKLTRRVRAAIEAGVDWQREVRRNCAEKNMGCGRRVASGLDWVFGRVEEAIIWENDCLPDPTFFPFFEELLARYREDEGVAQIGGCSFLPSENAVEGGYFFSRYPHCRGWATWRRAWSHYDHDMRDGCRLGEAAWAVGPENEGERKIWAKAFDAVLSGTIDNWHYRWTSSMWARGWLSANSRVNIISSLGFAADAPHTRSGAWGNLPMRAAILPAPKRECVIHDKCLDKIMGKSVFAPPASPIIRGITIYSPNN